MTELKYKLSKDEYEFIAKECGHDLNIVDYTTYLNTWENFQTVYEKDRFCFHLCTVKNDGYKSSFVNMIYVYPEYRRQHFARRFIQQLQEQSDSITVVVSPYNIAIRELLDKHGFIPSDTIANDIIYEWREIF